jgi:geranylgeranyl diphosphate synthase type I
MTMQKFEALTQALDARNQAIYGYLSRPEYTGLFKPAHIGSAVYSYLSRGGKRMRPALLLLSCGAVGGDETVAVPAAAAIEIYHTMTLVHDDIIDRDELRRGAPTVHREFALKALRELSYNEPDGAHYGLTIALLTGDVQHAWSMLLFVELAQKYQLDANLVLAILSDLNRRISPHLVAGETLDFQQSRRRIESLTEAEVIDMVWKKTAILYDFAGRVGSAIGLGDVTLEQPLVQSIAAFCSRCGIAFQLQDDILGITGNEAQLGKPIGSDIREGKRTTIVLRAFSEANSTQRDVLTRTLGNPAASPADIDAVIKLVRDLGGIAYTQDLALRYVTEALSYLEPLPPSNYKDLLTMLAQYTVEREF